MSKIPEHLKEKIKSIPSKPGVYQMKDAHGNIIYVGKSKTLNSRVKSYFHTQDKWNKIKKMVFNINDIDFIVTDTHLEAQILECALIKKIKPIFNAQLKNDKKYLYLNIENFNRFKPISIVHEREDENCFGPYRSKGMLLDVIKFFQNVYPIRKYGDTYEFTHKIIPQAMEKDSFEENKKSLIEIFSIKESMLEFLFLIEKKMINAASELQFETASIYRDMQSHVKYLYNYNSREISSLKPRKILMGERVEDGYKIFYISNDRIILKRKYKKLEKEAIYEFLVQAKELEKKVSGIKNEKRDLDFKYIVNAEIRDQTSKSIQFIDSNYDLDKFIDKLKKY